MNTDNMSIEDLVLLVAHSFPYFCKLLLSLPARDWKSEPEISGINSIPFQLAEHQLAFMDYLKQPGLSDYVVLKTRQRGYSAIMLAWVLWRVLYGTNENILYCIDRQEKTFEFRSIIAELYKSIPEALRPTITIYSSSKIINGARNNRLHITTATENVGRSGTLTTAILDECAYYNEKTQEAISAALTSSCPNNRIWISTPRREGDTYHKKVLEAQSNGTLWKHDYWDWAEEWFGSIENAKRWRKKQEMGLSASQITRELDCGFKGAVENPVWVLEDYMFKTHPNKPNRCIIGLDVGWSDDTAVLWAEIQGTKLHFIDEYVTNHEDIPSICNVIKGKGYTLVAGIVDSNAKKVDQTSGASIYALLRRYLCINFFTRKSERIEMLKLANTALIEGYITIDKDKCPKLTEMLWNYSWDGDRLPRNEYKHLHDAFVYIWYNWNKLHVKNPKTQAIYKSQIMANI